MKNNTDIYKELQYQLNHSPLKFNWKIIQQQPSLIPLGGKIIGIEKNQKDSNDNNDCEFVVITFYSK